MLKETVKSGTAKNLNNGLNLYAKTGTVGDKNGNSDAYCISFNPNICVGVWVGNKINAMPNNITGGSLPTIIANKLWKEIYCDKPTPNDFTITNAKKVSIDAEEYKKGNIFLADNIAPKRYVKEELFRQSRVPSKLSNSFASPKIINSKISVNNNVISIRICVAEYINYLIFKESNNKKKLIYDSKISGKKEIVVDNKVDCNTVYQYSIVPYYVNDNCIYKGNEIYLDKIKTSINNEDEYWLDVID